MSVSSTTILAVAPAISVSRLSPSELVFPQALRVTFSLPSSGVTYNRRRNLSFFVARSAEDDSSSASTWASSGETATAVEDENEESENPPAEVLKGPPSLISAINIEKALRGIAITDVDHYSVLGLQRGCPYDQIPIAYQNRLQEVKTQGLEEVELNQELELLKESYTILSTPEERRLYDWSLARNEQPDRYKWPSEADVKRSDFGDPPPQEPEDVGPTRLVGYFMLGWLVLAFTLSIVLNR